MASEIGGNLRAGVLEAECRTYFMKEVVMNCAHSISELNPVQNQTQPDPTLAPQIIWVLLQSSPLQTIAAPSLLFD